MNEKYTLIYADPPWTYRDKAKDGERGAGHKYQTMTVLDICRLPVWELAAENCLLAMWWVPTQPLEALRVVEAWGFRLMTMKGFTWNKCYSRQTNKLALGMGHLTRANSEDCLFAVQGKLPARLDAGIVQSFTAPRLEHSRKPDIVRESWCSCWAMYRVLSYSPASRPMVSMCGEIRVNRQRWRCCRALQNLLEVLHEYHRAGS